MNLEDKPIQLKKQETSETYASSKRRRGVKNHRKVDLEAIKNQYKIKLVDLTSKNPKHFYLFNKALDGQNGADGLVKTAKVIDRILTKNAEEIKPAEAELLDKKQKEVRSRIERLTSYLRKANLSEDQIIQKSQKNESGKDSDEAGESGGSGDSSGGSGQTQLKKIQKKYPNIPKNYHKGIEEENGQNSKIGKQKRGSDGNNNQIYFFEGSMEARRKLFRKKLVSATQKLKYLKEVKTLLDEKIEAFKESGGQQHPIQERSERTGGTKSSNSGKKKQKTKIGSKSSFTHGSVRSINSISCVSKNNQLSPEPGQKATKQPKKRLVAVKRRRRSRSTYGDFGVSSSIKKHSSKPDLGSFREMTEKSSRRKRRSLAKVSLSSIKKMEYSYNPRKKTSPSPEWSSPQVKRKRLKQSRSQYMEPFRLQEQKELSQGSEGVSPREGSKAGVGGVQMGYLRLPSLVPLEDEAKNDLDNLISLKTGKLGQDELSYKLGGMEPSFSSQVSDSMNSFSGLGSPTKRKRKVEKKLSSKMRLRRRPKRVTRLASITTISNKSSLGLLSKSQILGTPKNEKSGLNTPIRRKERTKSFVRVSKELPRVCSKTNFIEQTYGVDSAEMGQKSIELRSTTGQLQMRRKSPNRSTLPPQERPLRRLRTVLKSSPNLGKIGSKKDNMRARGERRDLKSSSFIVNHQLSKKKSFTEVQKSKIEKRLKNSSSVLIQQSAVRRKRRITQNSQIMLRKDKFRTKMSLQSIKNISAMRPKIGDLDTTGIQNISQNVGLMQEESKKIKSKLRSIVTRKIKESEHLAQGDAINLKNNTFKKKKSYSLIGNQAKVKKPVKLLEKSFVVSKPKNRENDNQNTSKDLEPSLNQVGEADRIEKLNKKVKKVKLGRGTAVTSLGKKLVKMIPPIKSRSGSRKSRKKFIKNVNIKNQKNFEVELGESKRRKEEEKEDGDVNSENVLEEGVEEISQKEKVEEKFQSDEFSSRKIGEIDQREAEEGDFETKIADEGKKVIKNPKIRREDSKVEDQEEYDIESEFDKESVKNEIEDDEPSIRSEKIPKDKIQPISKILNSSEKDEEIDPKIDQDSTIHALVPDRSLRSETSSTNQALEPKSSETQEDCYHLTRFTSFGKSRDTPSPVSHISDRRSSFAFSFAGGSFIDQNSLNRAGSGSIESANPDEDLLNYKNLEFSFKQLSADLDQPGDLENEESGSSTSSEESSEISYNPEGFRESRDSELFPKIEINGEVYNNTEEGGKQSGLALEASESSPDGSLAKEGGGSPEKMAKIVVVETPRSEGRDKDEGRNDDALRINSNFYDPGADPAGSQEKRRKGSENLEGITEKAEKNKAQDDQILSKKLLKGVGDVFTKAKKDIERRKLIRRVLKDANARERLKKALRRKSVPKVVKANTPKMKVIKEIISSENGTSQHREHSSQANSRQKIQESSPSAKNHESLESSLISTISRPERPLRRLSDSKLSVRSEINSSLDVGMRRFSNSSSTANKFQTSEDESISPNMLSKGPKKTQTFKEDQTDNKKLLKQKKLKIDDLGKPPPLRRQMTVQDGLPQSRVSAKIPKTGKKSSKKLKSILSKNNQLLSNKNYTHVQKRTKRRKVSFQIKSGDHKSPDPSPKTHQTQKEATKREGSFSKRIDSIRRQTSIMEQLASRQSTLNTKNNRSETGSQGMDSAQAFRLGGSRRGSRP